MVKRSTAKTIDYFLFFLMSSSCGGHTHTHPPTHTLCYLKGHSGQWAKLEPGHAHLCSVYCVPCMPNFHLSAHCTDGILYIWLHPGWFAGPRECGYGPLEPGAGCSLCWMFGMLGTDNPYFWDVVYGTQRKTWLGKTVQPRRRDAVPCRATVWFGPQGTRGASRGTRDCPQGPLPFSPRLSSDSCVHLSTKVGPRG